MTEIGYPRREVEAVPEKPVIPAPRLISVIRATRPLLRMLPIPAMVSDPKIEPIPISESRLP